MMMMMMMMMLVINKKPMNVNDIFNRLLRYDENGPERQLKEPPPAFLEADAAEVSI